MNTTDRDYKKRWVQEGITFKVLLTSSYEEKNSCGKNERVREQQENSYESAFLASPDADNEGWDETVYFCNCIIYS